MIFIYLRKTNANQGKKMRYTESLVKYNRRKTKVVKVGKVTIGGNNPVRV